MGRKEKDSIIIFSVFRKNETDSYNTEIHDAVKETLKAKNVGFKEILTMGNTSKLNFLVLSYHIDVVKDLCKQFNQATYIFSGPERETSYCDMNDVKNEIGTLKRIEPIEAKELNDYMYDFSDHSLWAIK